jgi:hypothetical protein
MIFVVQLSIIFPRNAFKLIVPCTSGISDVDWLVGWLVIICYYGFLGLNEIILTNVCYYNHCHGTVITCYRGILGFMG